MINDYTSKNFQLQGINFFNNSQNKTIKEIIEGASSNILESLFLLKYDEDFQLNEEGHQILTDEYYLKILPLAMETLLLLGNFQISMKQITL